MSFLKRVPREIFRSALTFQFLIIVVFLSPSAVSSSPSKNLTVEEAYPGLATGMLKLAKLSDLGKGEILKTQDVLIKESSLNEILSKTAMIKRWNVRADRNIFLGTLLIKTISNPCCDVFVFKVRSCQ